MKLTCPFCDTKYSAVIAAGKSVECACCGHQWLPSGGRLWGRLITVLFAVCLVMLVAIVAATFYVKDKRHARAADPLAVSVISLTREEGDAWLLRGAVKNQSDRVFGVPVVTAVMRDDKGKVIGRQKFSPEVPLLAPSERAEFSHKITITSPLVKKIGLEFEKVSE